MSWVAAIKNFVLKSNSQMHLTNGNENSLLAVEIAMTQVWKYKIPSNSYLGQVSIWTCIFATDWIREMISKNIFRALPWKIWNHTNRSKRHWISEGNDIQCINKYSRLPITRTFKGNRRKFELSGVRVIGSSKKIAGSKVKNLKK